MAIPKRLLISGIGKRNYLIRLIQGECESLGIELIGADASPFAPARVEVNEFYQLAHASDPSYATRYAELVLENNIDAGITLIDPEIPIVARMLQLGELKDFQFLHPSFQSTIVCEDKLAFARVLESSGIGFVPTFETPPNCSKYISKDRRGSAASGFIVHNSDSSMRVEPSSEIIYQPFISGSHYCIDAYYDIRTSTLRDFCVKEVLDKSSGESFHVKSVDPLPFLEICTRISEAIPLSGIVNFDVYPLEGEFVCMEINCRIGGNYPASHRYGINLLARLLRDAFDLEDGPRAFSSYEHGLHIGKYFAFTEPFIAQ